MYNLNPYQQIDKIFIFIKEKADEGGSFSREYIWNLFVSKDSELNINKTMYNEMIAKLREDGYIRAAKPVMSTTNEAFHVTFKGRLFTGYEAEYIERQQSQQNIAELQKWAKKYQEDTLKKF
ncbi:hypothetical protein ECE50_017530 [Chitinophaga sp. Mgbs1]|uniref:Uncharacterized protein n=1 Tax=Chitinophaga solisilvae TaxID=1233460 RepID=A0A9Q5DAZ5_9BACT|nr:hypothetical protein [Chitinophaga solisilvae]